MSCRLLSILLPLSLAVTTLAQTTQPDRIAPHPDLSRTTRLSGHVPLWARAEDDLGPLPDATPLRITLVLARSPQLQAAFTQLLADQQNPASPSYHHWLTPHQVGLQYGPTQHDLDTLTAWLTSRGLAVTEIAPSRVFLHAAAPASVIANAFATTFHTFQIQGAPHHAALTEPSIPTEFLPLVNSITGLADTPIQPMHQQRSAPQSNTTHPEDTTSAANHYVTPGDFAVIFDAKPTYNAGLNGAGQKVAIIGRSRVVSTDISEFEANTGLATNLPNVIIPPSGVDPGITGTGDQGEATLDVVRVIGTAPGVQADLVVSGSAGGFNGIYVAAQYEVQTLLDPVMNISFGSCEVYAGPAQVNLWDTLFAQAASEGISVFVSAADSGAATCDTQFAVVPDYQFRSINYICASSYATCVGGTEFADLNAAAYWSTTNGPGLVSALSYIPEGAWNETGTNGGLNTVAAGGGGASIYIPKPLWQTGTGVPADGARDVPDVSFPAAGHDGYYACYALGGGDCANGRFEYFFGTSAAAPAMAAVTALLNQKTGSSHGNLNPLLYRTAASSPAAFHDATPATSGVINCTTATPSLCNNSTPGTVLPGGGLAGYALTTGYDQATGLGSLDIANFLNAASTPAPTLANGKLTLTEASATIANTQSDVFTATYTSTASGSPTGTVQFYADNTAIGAPIPLASGKAVTPAIPFPAAGAYDISAIYSGDATFAQTTSPAIALTVTGLTTTPTISLAPSQYGNDPSIFSYGASTFFGVALPAATGSAIPTGMVRFYLLGNGTGSYIATAPLSGGAATTNYTVLLPPGSYTLTVFYLGDSVYSPAASAPQPITIKKIQSVASLSTNGGTIGAGGYQQFIVNLLALSALQYSAYPTGTMQLYANGTALGTPFTLTSNRSVQSILTPTLFSAAGTYTVTAVYSGDSYWQPQTSNPLTQTVLAAPASYALALSTPTLSLSAGTSGADSLTVQPANGFQGNVNLACAVVYNGAATGNIPPTCSLSTASVPVAIFTNLSPVTISIVTLATRSQSTQTRVSASKILAGSSLFCALLFLGLPRHRRFRRPLSSAALLAAIFVVLCGCGSSGSSASSSPPATPIPGTTPGSYTVTVTASTTAPGVPVPPPATIAVTVN